MTRFFLEVQYESSQIPDNIVLSEFTDRGLGRTLSFDEIEKLCSRKGIELAEDVEDRLIDKMSTESIVNYLNMSRSNDPENNMIDIEVDDVDSVIDKLNITGQGKALPEYVTILLNQLGSKYIL